MIGQTEGVLRLLLLLAGTSVIAGAGVIRIDDLLDGTPMVTSTGPVVNVFNSGPEITEFTFTNSGNQPGPFTATRKVKILERAQSLGDVPTRRTAARKNVTPIVDRVTLCYFRFGMLSLDSPFSPQP